MNIDLGNSTDVGLLPGGNLGSLGSVVTGPPDYLAFPQDSLAKTQGCVNVLEFRVEYSVYFNFDTVPGHFNNHLLWFSKLLYLKNHCSLTLKLIY